MDTTNLSLESKRELARALWTRQHAKRANALEFWAPWKCRHNHPSHVSQETALQSQARRRLIMGGNRSGKSNLGAADVAHMFLGTHPYRENRVPCDIRVIAASWEKIKDPVLKYLLQYIPKSSLKCSPKKNSQGIEYFIEGINGSTIQLMSHNQDLDEFESFAADMAWYDEPPPIEIWEGVRRGLIDRRGTELFTMTPIKEPWIFEKFVLPAQEGKLKSTAYFELHTECNPYISEEELKELEEDYPDEETRNSRLYGRFRHLEGVVYKSFDPQVHVIPYFDWPEDWPVYMCIDPHPQKPHAVSWVGIDKHDRKIIIDELKYAGPIWKINEHTGMMVDCLAKRIREKEEENNYKVVDRFIDTSIKAIDRTDQKKLLGDAGIRCRYPHKHDRVGPGIEKVQQLLQPVQNNDGVMDAQLLVRENCKGHIKEFRTYVWSDTDGKPRKINDDYMDNVRYICDTNPQFSYIVKPISYVKGLGTYGQNTKRKKPIRHRRNYGRSYS